MKGAEVIERKDTDLFSASSPMALGHFLRDCQRQQTGRDGQVTRKGGVMTRLERGKTSKKVKVQKHKNQTVGDETISVTASVTSGGHSKEGMKAIIIGLGEKNSRLLEQNEALQKKVEKLEQDSRGRKREGKVEAKTSKAHLKERPFKCKEEGCERAFAMKKVLVRHKRVVHLKERNYICVSEGCVKKFALRNDLERHIRTVHLKERNFTCQEVNCGKKFGRKSNLDRHRRGEHLKEKYNCGECNKEFMRKDNLKFHVKMLHQKDKPYNCKEYVCLEEGCGKSYGRKSNLDRHRRGAHLKEKHNCGECNKEFMRKDNLKFHVKMHHQKDRPYNCKEYVCLEEGCGKSYGIRSNLGRHVKNIHQRE